MPPADHNAEWELPRLRSYFAPQEPAEPDPDPDKGAHDVKFYPYSPIKADPVFAIVSKNQVVVCRLSQSQSLKDKDANPCEVLRIIKDADPDASNFGCCWSKDPETEAPLLCVAGNNAKIKVYDVKEGKLARTLVGHGGSINDLATSPDNPLIFASASDDTTIRIWSLDKAHMQQPCLAILGGEGHSWDILTVSFHQTGRYVLSAGHDQVISLWTLPDLATTHTNNPIVVHYPHFSTSQVHSGLVDCVTFFGDLILSRACHEESIVLWRIEGFSSDDPPLPAAQAPTAYDPSKPTRSAFNPVISASQPAQYTRLLQFHTPDCGVQFFMRFKVFHAPGKHPVLAFCNAKSRTLFWDLARLPAYNNFIRALKDPSRDRTAPLGRPSWLTVRKPREPKKGDVITNLRHATATGDKDSMVSASPDPEGVGGTSMGAPSGATGVTGDLGYSQKMLQEWEEMYDTSDPHGMIRPHRAINTVVNEANFVGRQVAWSPGGEWCLVVGNNNRVIIYQRWAEKP
ncbi:WD40 repeat-like protein [Thozetella sp. PMI_491]|nr:WD40 repeat-like protein [Thozetella sp. PMI_491]